MYKLIVDYDLMSIDQQVIYAAVNTMNVTTRIQTYKSGGRTDSFMWFSLGYYARDAVKTKRNATGVEGKQHT